MGFFKRRYFLEKTLGKYLKLMVVNFSTEEFRFRTPSLEICYSNWEYGCKAICFDFLFWSIDLYFYPDGDSAESLISTPSETVIKSQEKEPELTKDNVAFRDVLNS